MQPDRTPSAARDRTLDRLKTDMQLRGSCAKPRLTVAEAWEIVNDLGLDPTEIELYAGDKLAWVVMERVGLDIDTDLEGVDGIV